MSSQLGKVVSLILIERFGPVIEKVARYLFQYGSCPLIYIKKSTELPLSKVKEALCILIKYNLVTFVPNKNENIANYKLHCDRVLLMLRYPKYINLIKKKFDHESEMVIEEILLRGYWTVSEVILKVSERIKKTPNSSPPSLPMLRDIVFSLITAKYLIRIPYSMEDKLVPSLQIPDEECHQLPTIDIQILSGGEDNNFPDKNIYWAVNFDRFHQDMRDKIIVTSFTNKLDENAGEFVKLLLQQMYVRTEPWAGVSNPIPIVEIKNLIRTQAAPQQLQAFFDQYVNVIEQDNSNIVRKAGEASGGSLQIFIKDAFIQFAWELVEQIVLEKFDSKAARIFRLVKLKRYIESDQIQQLAMIPAKEAKRLSYQLVEENFLQIQELRKASANTGPTKSFTLFHIQLDQIVRMILELCYKTLFNIMSRRSHEKDINKRIIDKKQRVDTIAMGMRAQGCTEEQLADIEEMITPPEKEILERIDKTMKKLNIVELEIDDTIFLLQIYLIYITNKHEIKYFFCFLYSVPLTLKMFHLRRVIFYLKNCGEVTACMKNDSNRIQFQ